MKKLWPYLFSFLALFLLAGCASSNAAPESAPKQATPAAKKSTPAATNDKTTKQNGKKILIAYFSHSGNTKKVANQIHEFVGGDIVEIKTITPYPTNYNDCTEIVKREKEANARPHLSTKIEAMGDYDVVFIGYPIWWYTAPMAIHTFFESYDLSGKTVIPFCTSGGSDISESLPALKSLCPNSKLLPGLTANRLDAVKPWLSDIGML